MQTEGRRLGMNVDGTAGHIPSEQSSLRAPQHFNTAQVVEIRRVVSNSGHGNVIDEYRDGIIPTGPRRIDPRSTNGYIGLALVDRHEGHAGSAQRNVADPLDAVALD